MMAWLQRAGRLLRSRRLAIWLLLAAVGLAVLGTLVPQTSVSATRAVAWASQHPGLEPAARALGLHTLYSSPVFLAILAALASSTAMCSVERTRWAVGVSRPAEIGERIVARLRTSPHIEARGPVGAAVARERLTRELTRSGLRVRASSDGALAGGSGRVGAWGSPVFHWALTALFVVIALGQLTRGEGVIGVRVGDAASLDRTRFGRWQQGPLYAPQHVVPTLDILAFERDYKTGDYSRGPAPKVRMTAGGQSVGEQWVYPNHPLRYGTMLVHMDTYGVAPVLTGLDVGGAPIGTTSGFSDWDDSAPDGVTPYRLTLAAAPGVPAVDVTVTLEAVREQGALIRAIPPWKRVRLTWSAEGSASSTTTELTPGQAVPIAGGYLRLDDVAYYVRMTVVDDWSVYPVYALFGLAILGLVFALLLPLRTVFVLVEEADGVTVARAIVRHRRGDPVFRLRVETAMLEAVGAAQADEEGSDA